MDYHFRLNYRMLLQQLRIDSFATKVQERSGPGAAQLLRFMMSASMLHGKALEVGTIEPMNLLQISSLLQPGSTIDQTRLSSLLDSMSQDALRSIKKVKSEDGTRYAVNVGSILYYVQVKIVEGLLEKKFGDKAYVRIFRALQALGCSNEKQLEEVCLLSIKRVRRILMDLVVEGVVVQHELNLTKGIYAYSIKIGPYLPILREKIMKVSACYVVQAQHGSKDIRPKRAHR